MPRDQNTTYTLPTALSCISNHENGFYPKFMFSMKREFKDANILLLEFWYTHNNKEQNQLPIMKSI